MLDVLLWNVVPRSLDLDRNPVMAKCCIGFSNPPHIEAFWDVIKPRTNIFAYKDVTHRKVLNDKHDMYTNKMLYFEVGKDSLCPQQRYHVWHIWCTFFVRRAIKYTFKKAACILFGYAHTAGERELNVQKAISYGFIMSRLDFDVCLGFNSGSVPLDFNSKRFPLSRIPLDCKSPSGGDKM